MAAPVLEPMLAVAGRVRGSLDDFVAEPKLDGWRAMVTVEAGRVEVRSRRGRRMTDQVPELAALAHLGRDAVLDGELVAAGGRVADFCGLSGALATGRRTPRRPAIAFVAFDLLWLDGDLLVDRPYAERRALLADLAGPALTITPSFPGEQAAAVFLAAEDLALEGIVLKRRNARYEPGQRSRSWAKAKTSAWDGDAPLRRPR